MLTIRRSTIHFIMPHKKTLTQRNGIEYRTPIPHRLLLFINRLEPFLMTHGRARPQYQIVIFPSKMNKVYPVVALRLILDGRYSHRDACTLFIER